VAKENPRIFLCNNVYRQSIKEDAQREKLRRIDDKLAITSRDLDQARKELSDASTQLAEEMARFNQVKVRDWKGMMALFVQQQMDHHSKGVELWEHIAPTVNQIDVNDPRIAVPQVGPDGLPSFDFLAEDTGEGYDTNVAVKSSFGAMASSSSTTSATTTVPSFPQKETNPFTASSQGVDSEL